VFSSPRCDVIECADGREALAHALVRPPSLLITELELPNIDGFALCDILRRDRTTTNVPILVVTKESRSDEVARVRTFADGLLFKPVTRDRLLETSRALLAHSNELRSRATLARVAASERLERSANLVVRSRQMHLRRMNLRFMTTTPPVP